MATAPAPGVSIVTTAGRMTETFRTWTQQLTRAVPLIGSGSPEGVQDARQGRQYMDTAGIAGAILYVKRDPDIAGDKTKGWILV